MSNLYTDAQPHHRQTRARWAPALALSLCATVAIAAPDSASAPVSAAPALGTVLRELVGEAQRANLELAGADASVAQRYASLDLARARYWPQLDFQARYTAADGGRTIDVPVGELVNPIYAALGRLDPGSHYPVLGDQRIPYVRTRDQETKLVLSQPLYDPRLAAGRDAAAAELAGSQANLAALRERVTRDMQQAYLRLLEAQANVAVLDATLELARENLKVNDSLVRHGKATRDLVYRAEADLLETTQRRLNAANAAEVALAYVNLLRNQPLDTPLPAATVDGDVVRSLDALYGDGKSGGELARLQAEAIERRGELKVLDAAQASARASEALARAGFRPTFGLAIEGGSQGTGYAFGANDRYVLASLVLRFNLFDGGGDHASVRAAHAQANAILAQRDDTANRVRLEVQRTLSDYAVARASIDTAQKRLEAARGGFAVSQKKRDLGQINQAEFIDARRALTDAALNVNQTRYGALVALAELDYAAGRADRALSSL